MAALRRDTVRATRPRAHVRKAWAAFVCLSLWSFGLPLLGAASSDTYAKTRYPIVLVPGAFAFDNILGLVDYWYGIPEALREQGAEVYVTNVSSAASNVKRGEELLGDVRRILALTGARKVNIIAHSQGGTAARYVASLKPEWIESVNCVMCLNEGTAFADRFAAYLQGRGLLRRILNYTISFMLSTVEIFSVGPHNGEYNSPYRGLQVAEDLLTAVGKKSLATFNRQFPEALSHLSCREQSDGGEYRGVGGDPVVNGVSYYSWGGTSVVTNHLDPIDSVVVPFVEFFYDDNHPVWDGLNPGCAHPLGRLSEGFYPINHFDAINQAFGLIGGGIHIPTLYALNANRLRRDGH